VNSIVFATSALILQPLILLFSLFLLFRGHNAPGGGFVGGLVAAEAVALAVLAFPGSARQALRGVHPRAIIATGLAIAFASGTFGLVSGRPFLAPLWSKVSAPSVGNLGTPLLFDGGIAVIGVVLLVILPLLEE
jgi:multisubunit Na+/H+ antiporter MnhB subunit